VAPAVGLPGPYRSPDRGSHTRPAPGAVMVFSLYVHRMVIRNTADSRRADERKQGAERDLRRAWRNVARMSPLRMQYYDPDVRIKDEPQAGDLILLSQIR
jgi:hypothetical protein